jgi:predicted DNA-binding transcriptional regulator AlpA
MIGAAETSLVEALGNLTPNDDGQVQIEAPRAVSLMVRQSHGEAASEWAVARLIQSGRCNAVASRVHMRVVWAGTVEDLPSEVPPPSVPRYADIPLEGPTPFSSFDIVTTDRLWEWWRQPIRDTETAIPTDAVKTDLNRTAARRLVGISELIDHTRAPRNTISGWVERGELPKPVSPPGKHRKWDREEVNLALQNLNFPPLS